MPSLADLIRIGKQYVSDALPGGSLNPEVNRQGILDGAALSTTAVPVLGDLLGLGADINRYATDPESRTAGNFALSGLGMLPFVPAMTAWHGSPHKFDKFSLDKIGTGEGAQAYGHGLYLAETPEVAQTYKRPLASEFFWRDLDAALPDALKGKAPDWSDALLSGKGVDDLSATLKLPWQKSLLQQNKAKIEAVIEAHKEQGNLYKTDIPDEAVARFLDWDKPLSQQSQEVQAALKNAGIDPSAHTGTGGGLISELNGRGGIPDMPWMGKGEQYLNQSGIPGIRYLDGGSRSAGQGSSNFVAFDPEMIRILERNGQATGLEPWKPGEYRLKDLIPK